MLITDFDGYLAEFNIIDGQQLLPASFGTTNTSTGRWVPSTVEPHPTTTTDIAVTVVSSGGNKYALDGVTQGTVTLLKVQLISLTKVIHQTLGIH